MRAITKQKTSEGNYGHCFLNGIPYLGLLDSGAIVSCITPQTALELDPNLKIDLDKPTGKLQTAGNEHLDQID